jgi:hypothetical protein
MVKKPEHVYDILVDRVYVRDTIQYTSPHPARTATAGHKHPEWSSA